MWQQQRRERSLFQKGPNRMVRSSHSSAPSTFSVDLMPTRYHKRILHEWSVHQSSSSNTTATTTTDGTATRDAGRRFVATLALPNTHTDTKHTQFFFETDRQARKFCQAFSPPKLQTSAECMVCCSLDVNNDNARCRSQYTCVNCGAHICEACTRRWSVNMVPRTYVQMGHQHSTYIRTCKACDWLSNAFCMALLQGRREDVKILYETVGIGDTCSLTYVY